MIVLITLEILPNACRTPPAELSNNSEILLPPRWQGFSVQACWNFWSELQDVHISGSARARSGIRAEFRAEPVWNTPLFFTQRYLWCTLPTDQTIHNRILSKGCCDGFTRGIRNTCNNQHTLSKRNHLMNVDIPYQTGSGRRGTLNWPFCV